MSRVKKNKILNTVFLLRKKPGTIADAARTTIIVAVTAEATGKAGTKRFYRTEQRLFEKETLDTYHFFTLQEVRLMAEE